MRLFGMVALIIFLAFAANFYFLWPKIGWKIELMFHLNDIDTRLNPKYYRCLSKAKSVKPGIKRKDFGLLFRPNGGISVQEYSGEYFVKDCRFYSRVVMVDVKFMPCGGKRSLYSEFINEERQVVPLKTIREWEIPRNLYACGKEDDILTEISQPYLDYMASY